MPGRLGLRPPPARANRARTATRNSDGTTRMCRRRGICPRCATPTQPYRTAQARATGTGRKSCSPIDVYLPLWPVTFYSSGLFEPRVDLRKVKTETWETRRSRSRYRQVGCGPTSRFADSLGNAMICFALSSFREIFRLEHLARRSAESLILGALTIARRDQAAV